MPFSFLNTVVSWFLKKRIHQIELFMKYPIEVQNETLTNLLFSAKETEFGKKFNTQCLKVALDKKKKGACVKISWHD